MLLSERARPSALGTVCFPPRPALCWAACVLLLHARGVQQSRRQRARTSPLQPLAARAPSNSQSARGCALVQAPTRGPLPHAGGSKPRGGLGTLLGSCQGQKELKTGIYVEMSETVYSVFIVHACVPSVVKSCRLGRRDAAAPLHARRPQPPPLPPPSRRPGDQQPPLAPTGPPAGARAAPLPTWA